MILAAMAASLALASLAPAPAEAYYRHHHHKKLHPTSSGGGAWVGVFIACIGIGVVGQALVVNATQNRELTKDEVVRGCPLLLPLRPLMDEPAR